MNSITKRWMRGSLTFVLGMLLVAEVAVVLLAANSYYSGARQAIMNRVKTIYGQLEASTDTEAEYADALRRLVGAFSETGKFELMLVDRSGVVIATTSGFIPAGDEVEDYNQATLAADGVGEYIGPMGESRRVMAISALVSRPAGNIAALRMATSLAGVDGKIFSVAFASLFIGVLAFLAAMVSGMYFVRGIVNPVARIEATATRIAAGDFAARIEETGTDELGRLCATINEMAGELGRTEQMKNEFLSSVSHELRTPLTAIKGWAETLRKVPPGDTSYVRGVDVILGETDRLYAMVEELLDFSRMQNEGLSLSTERLDLAAEVGDAVLMFAERARAEGRALTFEEPEAPVPVRGDRNRLRQVFVNVLDNALKYAAGRVSVTLATARGSAVLTVEDDGPGIAPEDLPYVKTKFYKGQGTVRGSGIGLAVADEIVTAHGGALVLESPPGKGARAVITLPLSTGRSGEAGSPAPVQPKAPAGGLSK